MEKNPIFEAPRGVLRRVWTKTALVILLAGWIVSGLFLSTPAGESFAHGEPLAAKALVEIRYPVFGWPLLAVRQNFEHFIVYLMDYPPMCFTGATVNEFQDRQCKDFHYRLGASGVFVLGPLFVALLILSGVRKRSFDFYREARRKIKSDQGAFLGQVVDDRELVQGDHRDAFARGLGLDRIWVQGPNRQFYLIYVERNQSFSAKEPLGVFEVGTFFGKTRWIGVRWQEGRSFVSKISLN